MKKRLLRIAACIIALLFMLSAFSGCAQETVKKETGPSSDRENAPLTEADETIPPETEDIYAGKTPEEIINDKLQMMQLTDDHVVYPFVQDGEKELFDLAVQMTFPEASKIENTSDDENKKEESKLVYSLDDLQDTALYIFNRKIDFDKLLSQTGENGDLTKNIDLEKGTYTVVVSSVTARVNEFKKTHPLRKYSVEKIYENEDGTYSAEMYCRHRWLGYYYGLDIILSEGLSGGFPFQELFEYWTARFDDRSNGYALTSFQMSTVPAFESENGKIGPILTTEEDIEKYGSKLKNKYFENNVFYEGESFIVSVGLDYSSAELAGEINLRTVLRDMLDKAGHDPAYPVGSFNGKSVFLTNKNELLSLIKDHGLLDIVTEIRPIYPFRELVVF